MVEGLHFGGHGISSSGDLQFALERFVAECEAAGMRISGSIGKILVFLTLSYGHKFWVVTQRMRSRKFVTFEDWLVSSLQTG